MYTYIKVKTSPLERMVRYKTGAEGGKKTTQSSSYRVLANIHNSLHVLLTEKSITRTVGKNKPVLLGCNKSSTKYPNACIKSKNEYL
jgi:hypothetical protein